MVLTLIHIENNIDEWSTGEHNDVPFTATAYKAKYCAHLKFIMDFEKKTREANIIPRLLKHMLKQARYVILNWCCSNSSSTYFLSIENTRKFPGKEPLNHQTFRMPKSTLQNWNGLIWCFQIMSNSCVVAVN